MIQFKHAGDTIVQVRGSYDFDCYVVTPGPDKLFTFDVKGPGPTQALLVMDCYGDDMMPTRIRKRIWEFRHERQNPDHAFCVLNTVTGEIGSGTLSDDGTPGTCMMEVSLIDNLYVPPKWLKRVVTGVRDKKRPYRFALDTQALYNFMDRSIGYSDLNPHVEFCLGAATLVVRHDGWVQTIK
jgi:hypothetical protein